MKLTITLAKERPEYSELQAMLSAELRAIQKQGITVTEIVSAERDDALVFGEIAQILIEHSEDIVKALPFLTAVLQLATAVLNRKGVKPKKTPNKSKGKKRKEKGKQAQKDTPLLIEYQGHILEMPCTEEKARSFIKRVTSNAPKKAKKD